MYYISVEDPPLFSKFSTPPIVNSRLVLHLIIHKIYLETQLNPKVLHNNFPTMQIYDIHLEPHDTVETTLISSQMHILHMPSILDRATCIKVGGASEIALLFSMATALSTTLTGQSFSYQWECLGMM